MAGQEQGRDAVVAGIGRRTHNHLLVGHHVDVEPLAVRDEFLALGIGVGEAHPSGALDGHRAPLGGLRPQHPALVGLGEVPLKIPDAVVPLLHFCRERGGILWGLCGQDSRPAEQNE